MSFWECNLDDTRDRSELIYVSDLSFNLISKKTGDTNRLCKVLIISKQNPKGYCHKIQLRHATNKLCHDECQFISNITLIIFMFSGSNLLLGPPVYQAKHTPTKINFVHVQYTKLYPPWCVAILSLTFYKLTKVILPPK